MNVWLLCKGDEGERVLGPFTALRFLPWSVRDALTDEIVLKLTARAEWMLPDSAVFFESIVVQSGTFESPWGDRGR